MNTAKRFSILFVLSVCLFVSSVILAQETDLTSLPGRIAYIGSDYNVYSLNFGQQQTSQLTEDASSRVRYQWLTWSFDGRLAYFCCDLRVAQTLATSAHISPDGVQPGKTVFDEVGKPVVYAAWSPRACTASSNCLDLAMLVNDATDGGFRIEIVRDEGATSSSTRIGNGAPFYYSWSPDGSQMVFHRNNATLDVYDVAENRIITTSPDVAPGTFQAPAWSPVDDRILSGVSSTDKTSLIITAQGQSATLLPEINGAVSFSWSPDGRYIAYRLVNNQEFGALFVVDALTAQLISRSSVSGVISFFWSPDSRKLAYVTFAEANGANASIPASAFISDNPALIQEVNGLAWSTLDIETGLNRRYSNFIPTSDLVYLLLYFDQFAQSHRIWSPDSRYLVYTETGLASSARPTVSVLDVSQPNSTPLTVANGVFAIWSFE